MYKYIWRKIITGITSTLTTTSSIFIDKVTYISYCFNGDKSSLRLSIGYNKTISSNHEKLHSAMHSRVVLFQQCGILCFSIRFRNCSDSVVFYVFLLDLGTVPTVWYFCFTFYSLNCMTHVSHVNWNRFML
jgi:hypothetical protein